MKPYGRSQRDAAICFCYICPCWCFSGIYHCCFSFLPGRDGTLGSPRIPRPALVGAVWRRKDAGRRTTFHSSAFLGPFNAKPKRILSTRGSVLKEHSLPGPLSQVRGQKAHLFAVQVWPELLNFRSWGLKLEFGQTLVSFGLPKFRVNQKGHTNSDVRFAFPALICFLFKGIYLNL